MPEQINSDRMDTSGYQNVAQASVPIDLLHEVVGSAPHKLGNISNGDSGESQFLVLVALLVRFFRYSRKNRKQFCARL